MASIDKGALVPVALPPPGDYMYKTKSTLQDFILLALIFYSLGQSRSKVLVLIQDYRRSSTPSTSR